MAASNEMLTFYRKSLIVAHTRDTQTGMQYGVPTDYCYHYEVYQIQIIKLTVVPRCRFMGDVLIQKIFPGVLLQL